MDELFRYFLAEYRKRHTSVNDAEAQKECRKLRRELKNQVTTKKDAKNDPLVFKTEVENKIKEWKKTPPKGSISSFFRKGTAKIETKFLPLLLYRLALMMKSWKHRP